LCRDYVASFRSANGANELLFSLLIAATDMLVTKLLETLKPGAQQAGSG
jgi:hypothetical protein